MPKDFTSYRFSDAVLPDKFVICGVELRPFCLGHFILLEHLNNPILNQEATDIALEDGMYWFFLALLVCSFTYDDAVELLNNEDEFKRISDQFFTNLTRNLEVEADWNIFSKMQLFKNYLRYYMDMPIYTEETSADVTTPSGTDWKQNLFLIFKKLGYKEKDILNMNMKKMFFEWCSYAEAEGAIKVMNRMDIDRLQQLRKK